MRMTALMIALPMALAGCVGSPSRPLGVDVSPAGIEVSMSNRQTCMGPAPGNGGSWSGTLQGCDSPYPYRVTLDNDGNSIRGALMEVFGAIGVQLSPIATVEIDGPAGNTWTFSSPPPSQFD